MRTLWVMVLCAISPWAEAQNAGDGWPSYGGDPGGTRYSRAKEITRANVAKLRQALPERGLDAIEQRRSMFGDVPLVERED